MTSFPPSPIPSQVYILLTVWETSLVAFEYAPPLRPLRDTRTALLLTAAFMAIAPSLAVIVLSHNHDEHRQNYYCGSDGTGDERPMDYDIEGDRGRAHVDYDTEVIKRHHGYDEEGLVEALQGRQDGYHEVYSRNPLGTQQQQQQQQQRGYLYPDESQKDDCGREGAGAGGGDQESRPTRRNGNPSVSASTAGIPNEQEALLIGGNTSLPRQGTFPPFATNASYIGTPLKIVVITAFVTASLAVLLALNAPSPSSSMGCMATAGSVDDPNQVK